MPSFPAEMGYPLVRATSRSAGWSPQDRPPAWRRDERVRPRRRGAYGDVRGLFGGAAGAAPAVVVSGAKGDAASGSALAEEPVLLGARRDRGCRSPGAAKSARPKPDLIVRNHGVLGNR